MSKSKHILYITYDGLTDPLGQSQILPYIVGLANSGYHFTILSFEKKERFSKNKAVIGELIQGLAIKWEPLFFTKHPPLVSKLYDALHMKRKAAQLQKRYHFDMVHCRSYIAADVGLFLKRKFGIKFFFDMRGFWADEKKDGGSWNVKNPVYKIVYDYYKAKEGAYLQNADYIISLTEAGKQELSQWKTYDSRVPVRVIPCCADMDLFSLTDREQKIRGRALLNLNETDLVLSYLGSVGTWYMLDEMLLLFRKVKKQYSRARFLFVTHTPPGIITQKAVELQIPLSDLIIREASRKEVPEFIKASDINVSFIKPVYSKISSSPTKLGEVLSMGIPVICNSGVGDVERIVEEAKAGYVIHEFSDKELDNLVHNIPMLLAKSPVEIREKIKDIYSLKMGVQQYKESYHSLFETKE